MDFFVDVSGFKRYNNAVFVPCTQGIAAEALGKGAVRRMRKSLFGLFFGVLLMLLMLAAMVSAPAEEEAPKPMQPVTACEMLPQRPLPPDRAEGKGEPAPQRRQAVSLAARVSAPSCPAADANGVPLLRLTYHRANFRAFHFPDEAG